MREPVRIYDPAEPVTITLTWEEWRDVLHWMEHRADHHKNKRAEVLANIRDPAMRAERAAEHERAAERAERLIKAIEAELYPAPPPKEE